MITREHLENYHYDPSDQIRMIAERLFKTRPRSEVKLYPYMKNVTQHVDITMSAALEHVDLRRVFKDAEEGQACFVSFCVSSTTEDDGYIKISNNVDVYVDQRKVYIHGSCSDEYVFIPLHVSNQRQRVDIKCYCRQGNFSFDYLLSSKVYSFMWAVDYLLHVKRTLPVEEYQNEEGIAISKLYPTDADPGKLEYVFPIPTKDSTVKDFQVVYPEAEGYIGYAYAEVMSEGTIAITNNSPIKVFVNGKPILEREDAGDFLLKVNPGDHLLLKSCRTTTAWGFSCEDTLLKVPVICSDRKQGDKWLLIGDFGKKEAASLAYGPEQMISFDTVYYNAAGKRVFWRLADGSFVRPYLDSFFFGQWFYALMLGHWGILKAAQALNEPQWQSYFIDSIGILGKWFEYMKYDYEQLGVLVPFLQRSMVLDHMDPLGTMGMNLAELYLMTGESKIKNTLYELKDALYKDVPRMENSIINRKITMWSDDLFMAVPFMVRLGRIFDEEKYYQDAFTQLKEYYHKMFMEEENVFSHIFFIEEYEKSNVPWGRGNGWVMLAMCEYLDHTPESDINRGEVITMYQRFVKGICALQGESGMWHQVLNQPDSYEETSCTAMFLYSLIRGVKLGILVREDLEPVIQKAYEGLCNRAIDTEGNIRGVCMGSSCSKDWRYYAGLPTVENDDHGTGIVLAALSEYAEF